ncbi:hypothetical protein KPATCC21470_5820 [Kitasatospora purpeofusca]
MCSTGKLTVSLLLPRSVYHSTSIPSPHRHLDLTSHRCTDAVTVRANHLTLGDLPLDLRPGLPLGYQLGNIRALRPTDVIPVQAPCPPAPSTIGAACAELDRIVPRLGIHQRLPGRWQTLVPASGPLPHRAGTMAASASHLALGQLGQKPVLARAQLHHPGDSSGLLPRIPMVRVECPDVGVATIDTSRPFPLGHDGLKPLPRSVQVVRGSKPGPTSPLPLQRSCFDLGSLPLLPTGRICRSLCLCRSRPGPGRALALTLESARPACIFRELGCRVRLLTCRTPDRCHGCDLCCRRSALPAAP